MDLQLLFFVSSASCIGCVLPSIMGWTNIVYFCVSSLSLCCLQGFLLVNQSNMLLIDELCGGFCCSNGGVLSLYMALFGVWLGYTG